MIRGLYTAASGMMTEQRRHDAVTNNIANLSTPGYKAMSAVGHAFPEMLISAMGGSNPPRGSLGKLNTGVFAEENILRMTQGDLRETYRPQDMAIISDILVEGAVFDPSGKYVTEDGEVIVQPEAFFTIATPQGERYTRDGSFRTSPDGTLITMDGMAVLGADGQPLVIDMAWDNVKVLPDGSLTNAMSGEPLDGDPRLMITLVQNPNLLVKEGSGRYRHEGEPGQLRQIEEGDRVEVKQGYLEQSNVDAAQSSVELMAALRAYEANQKVIQFLDRSLDKAVNEIARL